MLVGPSLHWASAESDKAQAWQRNRGCRERRSGAFGRLEQSPMLEDRVAVGHPGDVISDCASTAGGCVRGFRLQRRVAVLRRHETHVLEKCLDKLLHHP